MIALVAQESGCHAGIAHLEILPMRWIWLLLSMLGFGIAFTTHSPGLVGIGLIVGIVTLFVTVMSMAAEKISSTARSDSAMLGDKEIAALRASMQKAKAEKEAATAGSSSHQPPEAQH
jgi:membrane-bound ClpP family serine protease